MSARRGPRLLLMGAYGQDNLGDEAILEVHLQQLADYPVTVVSTDPAQTSARYGVPSVKTYGKPSKALRAFLDSDVVIYGGGSLVKELPPPFFRYRLLANLTASTLAARALGKGAVFSAMGVERLPSPAGRFLARRAANASDLFLTRDEGSRRKLEGVGARKHIDVAADAAFLLEEDAAARERADAFFERFGNTPFVALNPISSHEVPCSREVVARSFAALAHAIRTEGKRVLWMPFKTQGVDNDLDVLGDIERLAPAGDMRAPLDLRPTETLAFLRRCETFVGMRHHGVLLSLVAGTTTVAVPYAEKTENLIDEMRIADHSLHARDLSADALRLVYQRACAERTAARERVQAPLGAMRERARLNFLMLADFLEARAS